MQKVVFVESQLEASILLVGECIMDLSPHGDVRLWVARMHCFSCCHGMAPRPKMTSASDSIHFDRMGVATMLFAFKGRLHTICKREIALFIMIAYN